MLSPPPPAAHILGFAQTLDGGGVEKSLLRLARGWHELGRRVTLVIGDADGPLAHDIPPGVETRVLGRSTMLGMAGLGLAGLAGVTDAVAPDVIFCPGNHYSALAAWIRLRLGRRCPPIVAKVSNALVRGDHGVAMAAAYRAWLRCHPGFVDGLVAMSPAMAEEACREMGVRREIVSVIPNPPTLVTRSTAAPAAAGAAAVPLPAGRFLLGVGRLAPQKRWDRLIYAFSRLAAPDLSLLILGEGSERALLEAQIAGLGLGGRVLLPGHVADPAPVIARATALALVSDFEGVPGVLREALALGTPVVSTESSVAVREIVTGPTLGSVVPRGDSAALIAALDHWLAPTRERPAPVPQPGSESAAAYLDIFDRVVRDRRLASAGPGAGRARGGIRAVRRPPLPHCAPARP